jgi:hypothetical protein
MGDSERRTTEVTPLSGLQKNPTFHPTNPFQGVAGRVSTFHRSSSAADLTCQNDIPWDRLGRAATIRTALSRWRHGCEPRWDCHSIFAGQSSCCRNLAIGLGQLRQSFGRDSFRNGRLNHAGSRRHRGQRIGQRRVSIGVGVLITECSGVQINMFLRASSPGDHSAQVGVANTPIPKEWTEREEKALTVRAGRSVPTPGGGGGCT